MISTTPSTPLNYISSKYASIDEKLAAIRRKNTDSHRNSNGIHEEVRYPNNSSVLCWLNQEHIPYPSHWHTAIEIIMPIDNIYMASIDNQSLLLKEGDILVIPPGILHRLSSPSSGMRIFLLMDYTSLNHIPSFPIINSILTNTILVTANQSAAYEKLRDLLLSIINLYVDDEPYWELSINAMFIQFLIALNQMKNHSHDFLLQLNSSKQKEYTHKFNIVFDYIDKNYTKDLNLETVAKVAGFSKFYFSRLFKQFTNCSFNDYLNNRRIQVAIFLLSTSELPITEIALASGFPSISTFNRVFHQIKNCSPTEFKKMFSTELNPFQEKTACKQKKPPYC